MEFHNFDKFKKSVKFNATRYEYGVKEENRLLQPLQEFFRDHTITPLPEGYKFDFMGEGKYVELKSRTCRKSTYATTCISDYKVYYAKKHCHQSDFYFVFNFTDGLYYWKYNQEQPFSTGTIYDIPHYFIPTSYLMPM